MSSTRLLDAAARHRLGRQELRVLPEPEVIAGAERTEFAGEGAARAREVLGVDVHSHEHVMAGQPAPRDDLRHRTPPLYNIDQRDNIAGAAKFHRGTSVPIPKFASLL